MAIFAPWHLGSQPTQQSPWLAMVFFQGGCMHNSIAIETPETPNLNVSTCIHFKVMWPQRNDLNKWFFVTPLFLWNTFEISFDVFFVLWKKYQGFTICGMFIQPAWIMAIPNCTTSTHQRHTVVSNKWPRWAAHPEINRPLVAWYLLQIRTSRSKISISADRCW